MFETAAPPRHLFAGRLIGCRRLKNDVADDGSGRFRIVADNAVDRLADDAGGEVFLAEDDRQSAADGDAADLRAAQVAEAISGELAVVIVAIAPVRGEEGAGRRERRLELAGVFGEQPREHLFRRFGEILGAAGGVDQQRAAAGHELPQFLPIGVAELEAIGSGKDGKVIGARGGQRRRLASGLDRGDLRVHQRVEFGGVAAGGLELREG